MQEKDLVGGMVVDSSTPYKSVYKGTVYYFCGLHCKKEFDEKSKVLPRTWTYRDARNVV